MQEHEGPPVTAADATDPQIHGNGLISHGSVDLILKNKKWVLLSTTTFRQVVM